MITEVSPTFMKGCHTLVPHTMMKSPIKNKLRGKGFVLVSGYGPYLQESQGKDLQREKKAKLVNNITSKGRKGMDIYIPAA